MHKNSVLAIISLVLIFLVATSAVPAGYVIKEAWRTAWPDEKLPVFLIINIKALRFSYIQPSLNKKRDIIIVPDMVNRTIHVHNGRAFEPVKIVPEMLGHRLGEFTLTRKPVKHGAAGIGATRSSASRSVK